MITESKTETNEQSTTLVVRAESVPRFQFHPDPQPPTSNSFSLNDLLRYHDRGFVQHAYVAIAGRAPTASELSSTLADLRDGRKTKIDIIEAMVSAEKSRGSQVIVNGLPSPTFRKLSRLPIVGYLFRVLRGLTRLPLMMQDQQRFESYAIAQQQLLADFINEEVLPAVKAPTVTGDPGDLRTTVADAVESVLMLSDSIIEIAGKQSELGESVVRYQSHLKKVEEQLTSLEEAQRELQSSFEKVAQEPRELQSQIIKLQEQREQSDARMHQDMVRLTEAFQLLQKEFEKLSNQSAENLAAQREFLVQEQQLIVEAQKVALGELELQIADTHRVTEEKMQTLRESVSQVHNSEHERSD